MTIKTFDAFTRLSINDINRITNFLFEYSDEARDTKSAIRKSLLYAAKEIPGLGGYVFVMEYKNEIIGATVVNKTGMNEYIPENILVYIAVETSFREKGIAKALIAHTIAYCDGDISKHINKDNPAIKLFEKQGFKTRNIEMRLVRN
ncbi:ribosomal protein S18 acetylase RimI-like enzyme [Mariniflexile fucanivorans]|uniref:Ribosomal protein S18 acetylase RimI-like enzyme n=1 Tax=Mariniflexile fucanivorans TaxID=264023 RepID=A0A4R1RDK4_9FLAO|nr:GNAT family N-acetyltransferase [Mariniflexile fucanivorans]TCL63923.1 ribosomal protein S18 acetylase RimI-like enzyme [Mariniflexile fucanivorans]